VRVCTIEEVCGYQNRQTGELCSKSRGATPTSKRDTATYSVSK
jgi:hypothetical protein